MEYKGDMETGPTPAHAGITGQVKSLEEVVDLLKEVKDDRRIPAIEKIEPAAGKPVSKKDIGAGGERRPVGVAPTGRRPVSGTTTGAGIKTPSGQGVAGPGARPVEGGRGALPGTGDVLPEPAGEGVRAGISGPEPETGIEAVGGVEGPGERSIDSTGVHGLPSGGEGYNGDRGTAKSDRIEIKKRERAKKETLSKSIFTTEYKPAKSHSAKTSGSNY